MNGLPVLNADAAVQIFIPTQNTNVSEYIIIPLHDNGLGFPDMRSGDGIYTVNLPVLSDSPGHYMLRLMVTAMNGQAWILLTTVENKAKGNC